MPSPAPIVKHVSDPYRDIKLSTQAAYDEIMKILAMLPDEEARETVLFALLGNRCRGCLNYLPSSLSRAGDPQGSCCHESRRG